MALETFTYKELESRERNINPITFSEYGQTPAGGGLVMTG